MKPTFLYKSETSTQLSGSASGGPQKESGHKAILQHGLRTSEQSLETLRQSLGILLPCLEIYRNWRSPCGTLYTPCDCALLFLYRTVLSREVGELEGLVRARRKRKLPVVLTRDEVKSILVHLKGQDHLLIALLYGTGMRLTEALRLRVKDVDFAYGQILIRDGKGAKDRVTMLPASLKAALQEHLQKVKGLHERARTRAGGKGVVGSTCLTR